LAKEKLAPAKEWKNRSVSDWNAISFRNYMMDLHEERFKLPYITNNIAAENKNIKRMFDEFGKETTKVFIDLCFEEYRPSPQYPNLSFFFMYSWMRERVLPQAIKKVQAMAQAEEQQSISLEDASKWF